MPFKIPSSDCFRRLAHGVLLFLLWQAACRNTAALAFRSGFYLARKPSSFPQNHWPSTSCCCPSKRSQPKASVFLQFRRRSENHQNQKTSLAMGLRDLLKRRILGRKDKDDNNEAGEGENDNDSPSVSSISSKSAKAASDVSPKAGSVAAAIAEHHREQPEEPQQKPLKAERRVVRMAEDPTTGEVNVQKRFGSETVQEKINRVKAGKMTDEEKEAFLRTALLAGDTPLSRPPLLQKKGAAKDDLDAQRLRGKASPFPTDTIIRKSFSLGRGGNNMTTPRDLAAFDSTLDTQKKKREYLDMVTNPDRFRTYKAVPSAGTTPSSSKSSTSDPLSDLFDDGNYVPGSAVSSSRSNSVVESRSINTPPPPPPNTPLMPTDLGARLGAHALASEKIAADLRRQAEEDRREKERLLEEERREQEKRNQEAQRLREAELLRREREVAERKRAQEETLRIAEEERKRKEEERLREMMQAQEAYWAKKLQAERSARNTKTTPNSKQAEPVPESTTDTATAPPEATSGTANGILEQKVDSLPPPIVESPLNDVARARAESQSSTWNWPQRTAAEILGRNPRKPGVSAASSSLSDFQAEQARKQAEIERTKALQLERLKALNSPIPNRQAARGVTPSSGTFQPQYPASKTVSRGLGAALSRTSQQPPPPVKDNSLDDMFPPTTKTTTPKSPLNDVARPSATTASRPAQTITTTTTSTAANAPTTTTKPSASSNNPLSAWAGLGNNAKKPEAEVVKPKENNAAVNSKGPVIRQQLPLDDNDDDEEDGIGRNAKGLSIAEVMKRVKKEDGDPSQQQERSKKWGVDMSRFREN